MTLVRALSTSEGRTEVSIIKLLQTLMGGNGFEAKEEEPRVDTYLSAAYGHQAAEDNVGAQRAHWSDEQALQEASLNGRRQAWEGREDRDLQPDLAANVAQQPWAPVQQQQRGVPGPFQQVAEVPVPSRTSAGRMAGPIVGARQPGSLWRTTNKGIGGIYH